MNSKAISIWEPERVEAFYRSIWPVDTGHPLIRIGGGSDGGYLVPDALNGIELCVSPGICNFIEFERNLGETYGIPSIACDPSPTKLHEVPDFIRIDQLALRGHSGPGEVTLSDWLTRSGHKDTWPLLLSMDIEGAELEVLQTASDKDINKIRTATIEFHYLHLLHTAQSHEEVAYAACLIDCIAKLQSSHDIVHMKPNDNCPFHLRMGDTTFTLYTALELTFLHKQLRRYKPRRISASRLPHKLDRPNVQNGSLADYKFYTMIANCPESDSL